MSMQRPGVHTMPIVTGALRSTLRTDIAWGDYRPESLKENTCQKRETGVRNEVAEHVKMPRNWKSFLGGAGNKKELLQFLTLHVSRYSSSSYKQVIIISGKD